MKNNTKKPNVRISLVSYIAGLSKQKTAQSYKQPLVVISENGLPRVYSENGVLLLVDHEHEKEHEDKKVEIK